MTSQCGPRRPNLNETKVRRRYDVACRVGRFSQSRSKELTLLENVLRIGAIVSKNFETVLPVYLVKDIGDVFGL